MPGDGFTRQADVYSLTSEFLGDYNDIKAGLIALTKRPWRSRASRGVSRATLVKWHAAAAR